MATANTRLIEDISEAALEPHADEGHIERMELARVGLVALAAALDWFGVVPAWHGFDFLGTWRCLSEDTRSSQKPFRTSPRSE